MDRPGAGASGNPELAKSLQFYQQARNMDAQGKVDKAALFFQAAINTCPQNVAPYIDFMIMLLTRGLVAQAGQLASQLPAPVLAGSLRLQILVAVVHIEQGRYAEAEALLMPVTGSDDQVLAASAALNLGTVFNRQDKYPEAVRYYEMALEKGANQPELWLNLPTTYKKLGDRERARQLFERAVRQAPDSGDLIYEYGLFLLEEGAYREGFEKYRRRWDAKVFGARPPVVPLPAWQPAQSAVRLLALNEQGVGDQILYAALIKPLLSRVTSLSVICEKRLLPLMARSFPEVSFHSPEEAGQVDFYPPFDAYVLLPDAGGDLAEARSTRGYLKPDPDRVAALKQKYRTLFPGKTIVAISWRSKREVYGEKKTIPLEEWLPLLRRDDVQCINFQYGDVSAELSGIKDRYGITIYDDPEIDLFNDLDGVAALAGAVDRVITGSNSNAHIAAAVGASVWLMVPAGAGLLWYWGADDQTCWYDGVRLFRSKELGQWSDLVERICLALESE